MPRRSRMCTGLPMAPVVDQPLGLDVRGVKDLIVRHAEGHARRGRGVDQLLAFLGAGRERLFHQHVLTGPDGLQRHREVEVVWQADAYRADLRVGDQPGRVRVPAHALRLERRQQLGRGVGDGHQARRAGRLDRRRVDLADLPEADHPDGHGSGGGFRVHAGLPVHDGVGGQ